MTKWQPQRRDPKRGTVLVCTTTGRIPWKLERLIDPLVNRCGVKPAERLLWSEVPLRLMVTTRQMSRGLLAEAGRIGARVVYLPRDEEWLAAAVADCVDAGYDALVWVSGSGR